MSDPRNDAHAKKVTQGKKTKTKHEPVAAGAAVLSEVYAAQNAVQTALTTLIEAYQTECDRLQG